MAKSRGSADRSLLQNAAKTLLANVRFASVDDPIKSIVVTSSVPNEGKTTVAVNLAEAIASSGKRVIVVECDMRKRSLNSFFNIHSSAGIYMVLTEQVPLNQAVVETSLPNLYFLDAEPSIPNPADIVSSRRFARLLALLEQTYDYVVIDTPPVGTFVDAAILSSLADATVFVIRENFTKRDEVANAFEQLKKADANMIGSVLNCCEESEHSSGYYYYEYYSGKKDGRSGHAGSFSTHGQKSAQGTRFK